MQNVFNPLEWIGLVWSYCYDFLRNTTINGWGMWQIMFEVWLVGLLIVHFRLGVKRKN